MKRIKAKVKKYNWKNILERMLFTFIQGMVVYLSSAVAGIVPKTQAEIKSLIIASCMAGLSAVMNLISQEIEMKGDE